jgi:hypothetical protein
MPVLLNDIAIGFFDGASQSQNCGGGVVLKLSNKHIFLLRMGSGCGTNTRA